MTHTTDAKVGRIGLVAFRLAPPPRNVDTLPWRGRYPRVDLHDMLPLLIPAIAVLSFQDSAPAVERVLDLGHPGALRVIGAEAVPAQTVLDALKHDRDFFEASHPARELQNYLGWLTAVTTAGYQHLGFLAAQVDVHVDRDSGTVVIEIQEGEQLLAQEAVVEGASSMDAAWLRAVLEAGAVRPVLREHLSVPPGPKDLAPALGTDAGVSLPPPFWVPGRPAPLAPSDRERFERLANEAARAAGLFQARLAVRFDVAPEGARPVVVFEQEGPLAHVGRVLFEGYFQDPDDVLVEWVAIPPGTPATEAVLQAAVERLQASGRFGSVAARFAPVEGMDEAVDLVLRLEQAPVVPGMADQPVRDMTLLRRMALRLAEEAVANVGLELSLALSPEATRSALQLGADAGLPVTPGEGDRLVLGVTLTGGFLALDLVQQPVEGEDTVLARFRFGDGGGSVRCAPLGASFDLPAIDWQMMLAVRATYATAADPSGHNFDLEFSGGVHGRSGGDAASPLLMDVDVSPSALLYLLGLGEAPAETAPDRIVRTFDFDAGHVQMTVWRSDARLVLDGHFATDLLEADLRFGELDDEEPTEALRIAPATLAEPDASAASAGLLGIAGTGIARVGGTTGPEWILVLTGVRALLRDASSERPAVAVSDAEPEFVIPRAPEPSGPMADVRGVAELGALSLIERQAPGSWAAELARAGPFLIVPGGRDELVAASRALGIVAATPGRGPVGAWLAAELCTLGRQPQWASRMSELALQDTSTEAFLRDCDTLFGIGNDPPRPSPVASAWRELVARAAVDESLPESERFFSDEERAMLRAAFAEDSADDSDVAWLHAGLAHIWETWLRGLLLSRLEAIGVAGEGR